MQTHTHISILVEYYQNKVKNQRELGNIRYDRAVFLGERDSIDEGARKKRGEDAKCVREYKYMNNNSSKTCINSICHVYFHLL